MVYFGRPDAPRWAPIGHKDDNAWNKVCMFPKANQRRNAELYTQLLAAPLHCSVGTSLQMLCWKGTLEREHQITKFKKQEMQTGGPHLTLRSLRCPTLTLTLLTEAHFKAVHRGKHFLRHPGASRDSQGRCLNTGYGGAAGPNVVHDTIPLPPPRRRRGSKEKLGGPGAIHLMMLPPNGFCLDTAYY